MTCGNFSLVAQMPEIHLLYAAFPNLLTFLLLLLLILAETAQRRSKENIINIYSYCGVPVDFWSVPPVSRLLEDS